MSLPFSPARAASRLLAGATDIRRGEGRAVLASGLLFFLVLTAIMVLRPVREALGLESGIENVRRMFVASMGLLLLLVPGFGFLVARFSRGTFLAVSFRACAVALLGFYLALTLLPQGAHRICGEAYYVFHSVINLFLVALFWAFMADLFSILQSKRLFPAIAVGGTLGAVTGAMLARWLVESVGIAGPFLVGAAALEAAVWTASLVARLRASDAASPDAGRIIGGRALAGITAVARSGYLLGIGAFALLTAVISTFLYFTGLRIVAAAAHSAPNRAVLFADIDFWTQFATLVAQAFIAGRIMRFVGVGAALAMLPACSAVGFGVLAGNPVLAIYTMVNAATKAVQRGIARPARETLFTVVPREDKYKAKSFVDTVLFRAGDAASAQIEGGLAATGLGVTGLALAVLPIALVWIALSLALAKAQSRRAGQQADAQRTTAVPAHYGPGHGGSAD
jgi:AAA family ATP:ADP antiporter